MNNEIIALRDIEIKKIDFTNLNTQSTWTMQLLIK